MALIRAFLQYLHPAQPALPLPPDPDFEVHLYVRELRSPGDPPRR